MAREGIGRNVWILGLVSMLNDITSEAIIPLLPVFVTSILGAGPEILGLIEGLAKATNNISQPVFGWLSDKIKKRKPFVELGYATSIVGRFLIAMAFSWPVVLAGRLIDRLGKGMRTPTRDALIARFSSKKVRGSAFGIHRALDTAGAVLGPLIALGLLPIVPGIAEWINARFNVNLGDLNVLFLLMLVPSILALPLLFFLVKEGKPRPGKRFSFRVSPRLKRFIVISTIFGLANFPIAFVLLKAKEVGLSISDTLLIYLVFNVIYTLVAYPAGKVVDKLGGKHSLTISYGLLGLSAFGFVLVKDFVSFSLVFAILASFTAMYEIATKAFTSLLARQENLGGSYGLLDFSIGLANLVCGVVLGLVWASFGSSCAFAIAGTIAVLSSLAMLVFMD